MFLHLSVILSTRGVSPLWTETPWIETPPDRNPPDRDPLDRDPPPRETPDWYLVTATEAGGTHPTGMHTCLWLLYLQVSVWPCPRKTQNGINLLQPIIAERLSVAKNWLNFPKFIASSQNTWRSQKSLPMRKFDKKKHNHTSVWEKGTKTIKGISNISCMATVRNVYRLLLMMQKWIAAFTSWRIHNIAITTIFNFSIQLLGW